MRPETRRQPSVRRRPGALVLLLCLALVASSCDLVSRVGGRYEAPEPVTLHLPSGDRQTPLVLILGQYGPELAGHLRFEGLADCPCLYVEGEVDGTHLDFESALDRGGSCAFLEGAEGRSLHGSFHLDGERLSGQLLWGPGQDQSLSEPLDLERRRSQGQLGTEDLRGCR